MVITSHNFFDFSNRNLRWHGNAQQKNQQLINFIINFINHQILPCKIPLVIGVDINRGSIINPYNGIDSVVIFLDVSQNKYVYLTHIWESWRGPRRNLKGFMAQSRNRYISFKNHAIGLLSCGDMYKYINQGHLTPSPGVYLDIYIDLAHLSLPLGRTLNSLRNNLCRFVNKWVLITQQIQHNQFDTYFYQNSYRLALNKSCQPISNQIVRHFNIQGQHVWYIDICQSPQVVSES